MLNRRNFEIWDALYKIFLKLSLISSISPVISPSNFQIVIDLLFVGLE